MAQTYKIDFTGSSPFKVFDGSGNVMFDANYSALRSVIAVGASAALDAPNSFYYPELTPVNTPGVTTQWTEVLYGKTFTDPPLFCCLANSASMWRGAAGYYAPAMGLQTSAAVGISAASSGLGFVCVGMTDRLRVGNVENYTGMTAKYLIFENTVSG